MTSSRSAGPQTDLAARYSPAALTSLVPTRPNPPDKGRMHFPSFLNDPPRIILALLSGVTTSWFSSSLSGNRHHQRQVFFVFF